MFDQGQSRKNLLNLLITVCQILFFIWSMFSMGCSAYHQMMTKEQALHTCRQHCVDDVQICRKSCHNDDFHCKSCAKQSTSNFFCRYKREQYIQGEFVSRELNSYRDPLQCRKVTCDCDADYQVCMQACSGTIHKRLQVEPVL